MTPDTHALLASLQRIQEALEAVVAELVSLRLAMIVPRLAEPEPAPRPTRRPR